MKKKLTLISMGMLMCGFSLSHAQSAGDSFTSLIVNNGFETVNDVKVGSGAGGGDIKAPEGWTFTYSQAGWGDCKTSVKDDGTIPEGTACFNAWSGTVLEFNLSQEITGLPIGCYSISAFLHTSDAANITDQHVYATVTAKDGVAETYASSALSEKGTGSGIESWEKVTALLYIFNNDDVVTIGAKSTGSAETNTAGWFQVDDFQLIYAGQIGDDEVEKRLALAEFEKSYDEAQVYAQSEDMMEFEGLQKDLNYAVEEVYIASR